MWSFLKGGVLERLWWRTQVPAVEYTRWSRAWWWETAVRWTVFAITGSTSAMVARPAVSKYMGMEGSMREGPWSYRIVSAIVIMPAYSVLLMTNGILLRRGPFFVTFAGKMWRRMIPSMR